MKRHSTLDNDFQLAYEVMLEDLKQNFNCYQTSSRSGSRTSSCSTEFEGVSGPNHHSSTTEPESPAAAALMDEQETTSDLWRRSTTYEDQCHLVPNPTYNAWEDNLDNMYMFCDENHRNGCAMTICQSNERCPTIKTEFKSHCEVPDITEQMNTVHLVENTHDFASYLKQETTQDHRLHVNFLNLKSLYYIKDLKPNSQQESIEDSEVYIFLKASLKIEHVKVYLKESVQNAATTSKGPLELQGSFDQHKGLLIVDLNLLSSWLVTEHTEWQLYVVTQFEDGNMQCCYSSPFQVQAPSSSNGSIERSSCYQLHGIQMSVHDDQSLPSTPPRHNVHDTNVMSFGERTAQKPHVQLLPGSKIALNNVNFELREEDDVVLIQEQPEFAGLLKLVKRNTHRDPMGRRRANGFRSAEETFLWVCGHCFFRRLKKSTVKSHVSRKVCLRNRRIFAESQLKGHRRPSIRRSNTYPIRHERRSSYDETFSSKTP